MPKHLITLVEMLLMIVLCENPLFANGARVASIAGHTITDDDLSRALGARLIRIHTEEYNLKRIVLEDMIATRLLSDEAARRHITVDELVQQEVTTRVVPATQAEIESVYEAITDRLQGMSKDEALRTIGDGMRRQRAATRRTEFVQRLRVSAGVTIALEPPRVNVKADGPSRGTPEAPVTIVEFSDFECPYCSEAAATLRRIAETYDG